MTESRISSMSAFFSRQRPAIRAAAKTTLGCILVTLVVMALHVPHEAWSLITVIVLSAPEVGASFQKGTLRLVGTLVGAIVAVVMIDLFSQYPAAFSLALFVVSMYASYRASGTQYPYAHLIGLVTLLIVGVQALNNPAGAEWIALARATEVAIGVIVTILITLSIWPVRATDKLHDALAQTVDDCRTLLTTDARGATDGPIVTRLLDARQQLQALLQLARNERDVSGKRFERLNRAVVLSNGVVDATLAADAIHRFGGLADPQLPAESPAGEPRLMLHELEVLAASLRRMPSAGPLPGNVPTPPQASREPSADVYRQAAASAGMATLARHVDALGRRVPTLGPRPPREVVVTVEADDLPLLTAASRQRMLDRVRLWHAFKVALSLQIGLWLWAMFHLPAGMQAMVTVLLVSQKTLGASQLKTSLRLAGAFVGGGIGLLIAIFIIPVISSLAALILVISPVLFLCAWVNDGSKRYGYAGFQAGFAFILTLIGGPNPMPDTMAPILRFTGIVIGAVVALTVMRSIAPVDAWGGSRSGIAALLEENGRRLRALLGHGTTADDEWNVSIAALRDDASLHLGELREGGRESRRLTARLDPIMHLASRFAAVVATITDGVEDAAARDGSVPELEAVGRAVEQTCVELGRAIRTRSRAALGDGPERALAELERRLVSRAQADTALEGERAAILIGRLRACVGLLAAIARRTGGEVPAPEAVPLLAAQTS